MNVKSFRKVMILLALVVCFGLVVVPAFAAGPATHHAKVKKQIDLNTATMEELSAIKALGAEKAKAIVDYRTANGPFASVNDLLKVSGIDEKVLKQIKSKVKVAKVEKAPAPMPAATEAPAAEQPAAPAPELPKGAK